MKIKFASFSFFGNPIYIDNVVVSNSPAVGISEVISQKASIYPNPNNGMFMLNLRDVNTSVQVLITDVAGKVVHSSLMENNKKNIDLSAQPAGIYFVNIYGGTFNEQIKIIKN